MSNKIKHKVPLVHRTDRIKPREFYSTDFADIELVGFGNYLLPLNKPDYRRERELYRNWKSRSDERSALEAILNDFAGQIWKMGGKLTRIEVR